MPIPERATVEPRPRILLRERAHAALLSAIVDGTLRPGERLNDQDLAVWLGVSRTPVREALATLARQGLVSASPGRQTIVTEIDPEIVRGAASVAAALHAQAGREALPRMDRDRVQALRSANARFAIALDSLDPALALDADDAFHRIVVDAARNPVLSSVLDDVMPSLRRAEHARFGSVVGRESVAGHAAIVEAFEREDGEAAAASIHANWLTLHIAG